MNVKYSKYVTPIFETGNPDYAEWFGYYNYSPIDSSGNRMLCNRGRNEQWRISPKSSVSIGFYDLSTGEWKKVSETKAWNWQQGALAHWLPGEGNENKIIFNIEKDGRLASKIVDVETKETKIIDYPIYEIDYSGKKSISIDLERSYWCRAYHYECVSNLDKNGRVLGGDGIFEIDLVNNSKRLLISIEDIINKDYRPEFENYKHWVEHIMISPSGKRFAFLHRFSPLYNVNKYFTRLFIANIDGSNLEVIEGWINYEWSHFGWKDDNSFVIYCYSYGSKVLKSSNDNTDCIQQIRRHTLKSTIVSIIRKLTPKYIINKRRGTKQYYQVFEGNNKFQLKNIIHSPYSYIDGHPSFVRNGRVMITDTYPDSNNWRHLVAFNPESGVGVELARFKEAHKPGNAACDLHPKMVNDGEKIIVDTTCQGKHDMIVMSIDWQKLSNKLSI